MRITLILLLLYFVHHLGQVVANGDRIWMLSPKSFLTDADCKGKVAVTTPGSPVSQAGERAVFP